MSERVAIIGSCTWGRRWAEIRERVRALVASLPPDAVVVSGGAMGVDMAAQLAAQKRGLVTDIHLPDWARDGRAAGFIRNKRIVANADRVVAIWNGESKGTMHTVEIARAAGKPVELIT